jgi:tetratricopeptide (TPR) repeat protein
MSLPSGPGSGLDESPREEFDDERPVGPSSRVPPRRPRPRQLQLAAIAVLVVVLVGGALAWRAHHRRKVVAEGLARAEALLRKDTSASYHEAARLLEPLVELDPIGAGAARGFALAMLALDYRDGDAARRAEELLVAPGRASEVPSFADLGYGALALSRREAGTAMSYAARDGGSAWSAVLHARVALLAGKLEAARDPLDRAAAADPRFPAIQALRGDVLRRTGHAAQAREAYAAALASSPLHARATYGVAKLALAGSAPPDEAREALRRLLDDGGTPSVERARAALHLASIEARAGRLAESASALDRASVGIAARGWLDRAVAETAQSGYRVPAGTPAVLESASDDDPFVVPPKPPPPTAISPTFRLPEPAPKAAPTTRAKPGAAAPKKAAPKPTTASAKAAKPGAKAGSKTAAKAKPAARTDKRTAAKPAPKAASAKPASKPESALSSALAKVSASPAQPKAAEKPGASGGTRPPAKATGTAPASSLDAAPRR